MTIKPIYDEKTINFNPTFVFYELSDVFKSSSSLPTILNLILLGFIVLIIYSFFEIEIIFIYKYLFSKEVKTDKELQMMKDYDKKLMNVFGSKIECINGSTYVKKKDGSTLQARNLKGNPIGKIPYCQKTEI